VRTLSALLAAAVAFSVYAQEKENAAFFSRKATLSVVVDDIGKAGTDIDRVIRELDLTVDRIDVNNKAKENSYTLFTGTGSFERAVARFQELGSVDLKKVETTNNAGKLAATAVDRAYLAGQKDIYSREMETPETRAAPETRQKYFEKARELDKQLYENDAERVKLSGEVERSVIELTVSQKTVQYLDEDEKYFDFINMPGVETHFYSVENPDGDLSHSRYFGGALRYLFTKGKTFFTIGILKPLEEDGGPAAVNDIVTYSIGKDFYPRYLGRGKRTFLNPYSGFQLGGMVLTAKDEIRHLATLEPHLGVELFKNTYVILDIRAGYVFPLDEKMVKTLRGFTQNVTFNIVF
jgi:hypothetical protein